MSKNLCGKRVDCSDKAYEVWENNRPFLIGGERFETGTWRWYVLKKYQTPEKEAENEYARWFCLVKTPIVPKGEYGDVYVKDIIEWASKIDPVSNCCKQPIIENQYVCSACKKLCVQIYPDYNFN
jgi:hypothetical protein